MSPRAPAVRRPRRRPAGPRAQRAKRRRAGRDRGAGSAEIVIAVPLLMLLILLVIQFAVWANAESIAHATAEDAASPFEIAIDVRRARLTRCH